MPAATPFLAHGRVLGATDRRLCPVTADTDIAADTLADILDPAFFNLTRQKRISNRGPGCTNHIQNAALHLRDHGICRGKTPHTHHRLAGHLFNKSDVGFLRSFLTKTGGDRIIGPVTHINVPQIRHFSQHLYHLTPLGPTGNARVTEQLIHGKANSDPATIPHRILGVFKQFAGQSDPVLQRAAVLITAPVVPAADEMHGQSEIMARVDIDNIESGVAGPDCSLAVPAPYVCNIAFGHGARLHWIKTVNTAVGHAQYR